MANENGTRTTNVEKSATLDHYLGSKGGSTRLQTAEQMAQQLLASGPMRAALPISGSNTLYFATKAAMQAANLSSSAVALTLISAWVYADETVENNGVYKPLAGTPVTWQRVLDLPMQWAEAEQIAGTTANAIKAKTGVPVSRSLIVALPITAANTAAPTVSFNGGAALSIVSNSGNPVAVGGLVPPMLVWGFADYDTSKFRLINDQVASAIVAAAEAAASSAKGYRDAAQELKLQAAQSAFDAKHYAEQAEESSTGSIEAALDAAQLVTAAAAADKFFILVDGALKAVTKASLGKLFGTPLGSVLMMDDDDSVPPPGYLLYNGAFVTSAYPELRAKMLATKARGANIEVNANGDPRLKDMGGYFPRGFRSGQLVDSGRVFGSVQEQSTQDMFAAIDANQGARVRFQAISPVPQWTGNRQDDDGIGNVTANYTSGVGVYPLGTGETRPKNQTFTYWVKAYAADQVPGSVDFAALANNVQTLSASVSALTAKQNGWSSSQQTWTAGAALVVAHTLGATPREVFLEFVCKSAWNGYAIGDRILMPAGTAGHDENYSNTGFSISVDASNIRIHFASNGIFLVAKGGGGAPAFGGSQFDVIVRGRL